MKSKSLAIKVLKGLAMGGAIVLAASSPYFGLNLMRGITKAGDKEAWRKFYLSLKYLDRRGYAKILSSDGNKIKVKISRQGQEILKKVDVDLMKINEPKSWDDKWRLVIFDVPNIMSKNRIYFSEKLKSLGFIMVQKSVWAYPYECRDEITILRKFYGIEKYVTYLEVLKVEDELNWRGKFNLKNQY